VRNRHDYAFRNIAASKNDLHVELHMTRSISRQRLADDGRF
jgi:hypothetical protein